MSSNLSTQQVRSQSNSIESLPKVQKQYSNESFSNTKIDPDINQENMECSECAKNTESNTIEDYGRSRYCRAAHNYKKSALRYLKIYRRTKRRTYLNYYRRYMRYYHKYRRHCKSSRRTRRTRRTRRRSRRSRRIIRRRTRRSRRIIRRRTRRSRPSRRSRRIIRRRTRRSRPSRRSRRIIRRRTRRTRRTIRRSRKVLRRARKTVRRVRSIRRSIKNFKSGSGTLILAILLATIPGFFAGWFLPKSFPGMIGRFVVPLSQYFFLILAFLIKDGNKCSKARIGNSIANAGYTWLITLMLHMASKYGAEKAEFLSISDNYMNPMGINLMTMVNTLLSMGIVSLTTSRKSLCKKKYNTKIAMFLAIVSIMGQGILINEPLQVIADVVEDVIEEVIEEVIEY